MFLKLGADPEIFLRDRITKDFVSAYGLFPGTKSDPYPLEKGAVQVDGMALEYNIHPAETAEEWNTNHETVLRQLDEMVTKVDPFIEMVFTPVFHIDPLYFALQPLEAKILGCDPDFGEDGKEKIPPEGMQDLPFRTAAGHIHIGITEGEDVKSEKHFNNCLSIAKAFRNVQGFVPVTTEERERARFYGAPPSFRPKHYGPELRSPSNLWVASKEGRMRMFNNVVSKMRDL